MNDGMGWETRRGLKRRLFHGIWDMCYMKCMSYEWCGVGLAFVVIPLTFLHIGFEVDWVLGARSGILSGLGLWVMGYGSWGALRSFWLSVWLFWEYVRHILPLFLIAMVFVLLFFRSRKESKQASGRAVSGWSVCGIFNWISDWYSFSEYLIYSVLQTGYACIHALYTSRLSICCRILLNMSIN